MYAHGNIWRRTEAGASPQDTAAHAVAARAGVRPGFRASTLVRSGEREVVAVTVFDSEAQLEAAVAAAAEVVARHVRPLAAGEPERRRGHVVFRECRSGRRVGRVPCAGQGS